MVGSMQGALAASALLCAIIVLHRAPPIRGGCMDTEQVLNQLLLIAGLLALPVPLLWMEARALQRVPRLASQPRWRERLALVPRVASIGTLLLAAAALALLSTTVSTLQKGFRYP